MTGLGEVLLTAGLVVIVSMTLLWLISVAMRDASIVDIFWGPGFVAVAWTAYGPPMVSTRDAFCSPPSQRCGGCGSASIWPGGTSARVRTSAIRRSGAGGVPAIG